MLAYGGADAAVLSHRTAAAAWDLTPTPAGPLDVTTIRRSVPRPKLRVHKGDTLDPLDDVVRQHDGLPVTTVARTLVDLADAVTPHRLERICHRAVVLRVLDAGELYRRLSRGRWRGARSLRAAVESLAYADPQLTRSELEERFLALVADAGLPAPLTNAQVAGYEVDFLWPERRLVVETDGIAAHLTPTAFEDDRRRDAALQIAGYRVARFTWRQVAHDARRVSMTLRALAS